MLNIYVNITYLSMDVCIHVCICVYHTCKHVYVHIHMYLRFRDWSGVNLSRSFLCGSALAEEFIFVTPSELMEYFSAVFQSDLLYIEGQTLENYLVSKAVLCHPLVSNYQCSPLLLYLSIPCIFFYKPVITIKTSTQTCTLC